MSSNKSNKKLTTCKIVAISFYLKQLSRALNINQKSFNGVQKVKEILFFFTEFKTAQLFTFNFVRTNLMSSC